MSKSNRKSEEFKKLVSWYRLMAKTKRMKEDELIEEAERLYAEKVKREKAERLRKRKIREEREKKLA